MHTVFLSLLCSDSSKFQSCYGHLVDTLRQLPDDKFNVFAAQYLSPSLLAENSPEAKAMVDAVVAVATNRQKAQDILVQYIFRASTVGKDLMLRAIHVCFTVKLPSQVRSQISVARCCT